MIKEFGVFEAKTHFSAILELVAQGQGVFITKHGKRVAEINPVKQLKKKAIFGCAKGDAFHMAADFDAPVDGFEEYSP